MQASSHWSCGRRGTYLAKIVVLPLAFLDEIGELGCEELSGHVCISKTVLPYPCIAVLKSCIQVNRNRTLDKMRWHVDACCQSMPPL